MSAWVPLFQTLAWVFLITGILWRFNAEVRSLVRILRERIEKGSSVKAGPFEIGASAPAQGLAEQRQELEAKVRSLSAEAGTPTPVLPGTAKGGAATLGSTILLAEDLAIRQIQSEFGASVSRQLRIGGLELDGLFTLQGIVYGVEIKYIFRTLNVEMLQNRVTRMLREAPTQGWRRFAVILALVYGDTKLLTEAERARVVEAFRSLDERVQVRFFVYDDLARRFGAADG